MKLRRKESISVPTTPFLAAMSKKDFAQAETELRKDILTDQEYTGEGRTGYLTEEEIEVLKYMNPSTLENAFNAAIENNYRYLADVLRDFLITDPEKIINDALITATEKNHTQIVLDMVDDPKITPRTIDKAILNACQKNYTDLAKGLFTQTRRDPGQPLIPNHDTPLNIAIQSNDFNLITVILNHIQNQENATGYLQSMDPALQERCLYHSVSTGQINAADILIKHMPLTLEQITDLIFMATANHHPDLLRYLLTHEKANPNHPCPDGVTVLFAAVEEEFKEGIQIILEHPQTDPDQPMGGEFESSRMTALMYALLKKNKKSFEIAQMIAEHPASNAYTVYDDLSQMLDEARESNDSLLTKTLEHMLSNILRTPTLTG